MVTLDDIRRAAARIADSCLTTPAIRLPADGPAGGAWLKLESLQRTGSFKLRGATNALTLLDPTHRSAGVVTHSSGNHGQALACAATTLGVPATVVMPTSASQLKIARTRAWGAEVVLRPATDTVRFAREFADEAGATLVPPFDDPRIIAGQGSTALELLAQVPEPAAVLVPVGGGGLISGVATVVKSLLPRCRVIAVEPELAGDLAESVRSGTRRTWSTDRTGRTIADGLRSSGVGMLPWAHIERYVDEVVTVTEGGIRSAMRLLAEAGKIVVEPSGAVATAALIEHGHRVAAPSVAVVTGGNIDLETYGRLLGE